jgi:transcriptional regulator of arginine metabolism
MATKQARQMEVARLVAAHTITSQPQLVDLLVEAGISATQATVSRDLDELGAIKVRTADGDTAYAIPEIVTARKAPPAEHLRRVMSEWVGEVVYSQNLVVMRTPPGCAHVVGSALDRSGLDGLLGTVAGDDTLLCVATETVGGRKLAATMRDLAGLS